MQQQQVLATAALMLTLMVCSAASDQQLRWLPLTASYKLDEQQEQKQQQRQQQQTSSKHWAVLVAGSNGWYNYRHQADICHAYQILRRNGIAEDRIITMMFDDLAENMENPTKGKIINSPNGTDVYHGVRIDYRSKEVTPENFLKVLRGEGSGRVLRSGPNDFVFINFADHGAPGLVGFPSGVLKAKPLIEALNYMHSNKMYKKLVFYMEACESGSMFNGLLPPDVQIYATTAANSKESSYACYYDKKRQTYLGDVYSVKWMEDSDNHARSDRETLDDQFDIVKEETNTSHVMKFGDKSIGSLPVVDFQGNSSSSVKQLRQAITQQRAADPVQDAVSQRDARESILRRRIAAAPNSQRRLQLLTEMRLLLLHKQRIADIFDNIVRLSLQSAFAEDAVKSVSSMRRDLTDFDCHHAVVDAIQETCFDLGKTEEALRHIYKIVNLCELGLPTQRILQGVRAACPVTNGI